MTIPTTGQCLKENNKRRSTLSNSEEMLSGELYKYDFLSPAIIYENGTYKMWAINQNTGHSLDYRESKTARTGVS